MSNRAKAFNLLLKFLGDCDLICIEWYESISDEKFRFRIVENVIYPSGCVIEDERFYIVDLNKKQITNA